MIAANRSSAFRFPLSALGKPGLPILLGVCMAAVGCGSGSSKGPTSINDQLAQARTQSAPDRQAVALLRVASKQNAAGDTGRGAIQRGVANAGGTVVAVTCVLFSWCYASSRTEVIII